MQGKMKILNKNKKALAYKMMNYTFLRLVFIIIFFYTIYAFASYGLKTNLDIQKTREMVLVERSLYSPNSFIYSDSLTGRSYPGIIDIERFDSEILDKAFNYNKSNIAARFELKNLGNNETKEIYLNKKWYDRWQPLTKFKQYDKDIKQRYVLIRDKGVISKGLLRVELVVSNE